MNSEKGTFSRLQHTAMYKLKFLHVGLIAEYERVSDRRIPERQNPVCLDHTNDRMHLDFLKNRIVGFDENATEDWRKDKHQSAQFLLLNLNCDFAERDGIVRALALGKQ